MRRPEMRGGDGGVWVVNLRPAILFAAGVYLCVAFFDTVSKAVLLFLTAFLVAVVLNAPVRKLERRGVSRGLSAAVVALTVLGGLGFVGFYFGPRVVNQAASQIQYAPREMRKLRARVDALTERYPALNQVVDSEALDAEHMSRRAAQYLPRIGRATLSVFGALGAMFVVLVVALYTLSDPKTLLRGLLAAVPPGYRRPTTRALTRIVGQLEGWAMATLLLMVIVGVLSGIGLWLLGVRNPILWGVVAGIGEGIPTIGPLFSAIPPVISALGDDPKKALWVALLFLGIQQVENNILVPILMARRLSLHPVAVLFFVLALGSMVGLLGALLAVPAAIIAKVLIEEFHIRRHRPLPGELARAVERIVYPGERRPRRSLTAAPRRRASSELPLPGDPHR